MDLRESSYIKKIIVELDEISNSLKRRNAIDILKIGHETGMIDDETYLRKLESMALLEGYNDIYGGIR